MSDGCGGSVGSAPGCFGAVSVCEMWLTDRVRVVLCGTIMAVSFISLPREFLYERKYHKNENIESPHLHCGSNPQAGATDLRICSWLSHNKDYIDTEHPPPLSPLLLLRPRRQLGTKLGRNLLRRLRLQLPRPHVLGQHFVRDRTALLLEARHVLLQQLDRQLLQLARHQLAALVAVVDVLELGVVLLEVGEVDVGDVDVRVATELAVLLEGLLAAAEGVLVDLGLRQGLGGGQALTGGGEVTRRTLICLGVSVMKMAELGFDDDILPPGP